MGGVIATALVLASSAMAQQPNWKDPNEYNLVQKIGKEANPAKKLALLQIWKGKYPATDFSVNRISMFLMTYQQMGKTAEMLATAKELSAAAPTAIQRPYWITILTISIGSTAPDALDAGEKAASTLVAGLDKYFDPSKKPAGTTDAALKAQRDDTEAKAHTTLGWVAWKRKNNEGAEKEFSKVLEISPNNSQVSMWLATVSARPSVPATQEKQEKMAEPPPPPLPPSAESQAPPKTIEVGQTTEQVVAALGQPAKIVKLGTKEVYFHKDLKITFVNGKVSDVE